MTTPDTADTAVERVVLLDEAARPIGSMPKSEVHTADTPLHSAFSCYLIDDEDRILLTRRALTKAAWPGVWTNSFCGHPAPGEDIEDALVRRADQELGTTVTAVTVIAPDFRYRAVDAGGIVENEVCPVYVARIASPLDPSPAEVAEWSWTPIAEVRAALSATPFVFSPWMVDQFAAGVFESLRP
ncbi:MULTISPECIES: isopentenyl-diphosphate Delta-isomerase [Brevibacterium]|uniref:isopentenyl-diphosphate Delta-isomerase n=1 Tax=Brevibacterium TaxID=1696 RepID=UPI0011A72222|nr:isopentenyl-diphosphate Delta-isomerase [Brevibacterium casei]MCT2183075.1 isopentenyl-diphosphate Delta-isomerase [Brevibacterium casei]NJE66523.1 isopentenyl-diphosphate Delta-isomerase [Brevibacterium sp. LS14]